MNYDSSKSPAPTARLLKNQAIPSTHTFDVRQADGELAKFDIDMIADRLARSMQNTGRTLDQNTQCLIQDLCSKIAQRLAEDTLKTGIMDYDDMHTQVEMTLILNHQSELAEDYLSGLEFPVS